MHDVPPAPHNLARLLVAEEADMAHGDEAAMTPALRAVEKLRVPLSKLSGNEGYRSLLSRALTLSKARAASLGALEAGPDGSLLVSNTVLPETDGGVSAEGTEDGVILLSELLGLLITFIGEALTLQLLRAVWPDATLEHMNTQHKETLR